MFAFTKLVTKIPKQIDGEDILQTYLYPDIVLERQVVISVRVDQCQIMLNVQTLFCNLIQAKMLFFISFLQVEETNLC